MKMIPIKEENMAILKNEDVRIQILNRFALQSSDPTTLFFRLTRATIIGPAWPAVATLGLIVNKALVHNNCQFSWYIQFCIEKFIEKSNACSFRPNMKKIYESNDTRTVRFQMFHSDVSLEIIGPREYQRTVRTTVLIGVVRFHVFAYVRH